MSRHVEGDVLRCCLCICRRSPSSRACGGTSITCNRWRSTLLTSWDTSHLLRRSSPQTCLVCSALAIRHAHTYINHRNMVHCLRCLHLQAPITGSNISVCCRNLFQYFNTAHFWTCHWQSFGYRLHIKNYTLLRFCSLTLAVIFVAPVRHWRVNEINWWLCSRYFSYSVYSSQKMSTYWFRSLE